jgi:hypothetical protein
MGAWERVITPSQRERYNQLLVSSNPAYATANINGLNRLLDERGGRAYIFTETSPTTYYILHLVAPNRDEPSVWKIVNAVPMGDYDVMEAGQISWRHIRDIFDEVGAESFYGTPLADYGDPKMNQFFEKVADCCWELEAKEPDINGKYLFQFKRTADRKPEDEKFEGPRAQESALHENAN